MDETTSYPKVLQISGGNLNQNDIKKEKYMIHILVYQLGGELICIK